MKIIALISLAFLLLSATPTSVDEPEIMSYAQQCLLHEGTLEKTEDGFVYIKVSDDYIDGVLERLNDNQAEAPPYTKRRKQHHISAA